MTSPRQRLILLIGVIAALAIAIPVLGADPSPSAGPSGQASPAASAKAAQSPDPEKAAESPKPDKTAKPSKADKTPKADKAPEVAVTVTGTVKQTTDGQGRPSFTLTAGATTWELSAGPPWYWGDKNPLAAYVGKSVTVVGEAEQGGTELDVDTVDGKAIRADGKPPWAGGPWVVGPTHPGWKDWMANGKPGKGQAKNAPAASPGTGKGD